MLSVDGARCVHQRSSQAACRACVDSCPRAAWAWSGAGLGFDAERCDGCGLCLPACPTQALQALRTMPRLSPAPMAGPVLRLACDKVGAPAAGVAGWPCVHAVDEASLLRWHADGVVTLLVLHTGCAHCERQPTTTLAQRLSTVNAALRARGARGMTLQFSSAAAPGPPGAASAAIASPSAEPDVHRPARRAWLGLPSAAAPAVPARPTDSGGRREAVARLHSLGPGPALWAVQLAPSRCDGCCACARLCPTGAITATQALPKTPASLQLAMSRCVGCGLCVDACAPKALSIAPPGQGSTATRQWKLTSLKCQHCGKVYRGGLVDMPMGCPTCPACRSLAARRSDRVVQQPPPPAHWPIGPPEILE
ncbi:MAG: 4Fe-4S binding protein [Ideonella sp.]|nr:4Fe-4S binding protein [Ideonella sp.]